jgi:RNase P protein component
VRREYGKLSEREWHDLMRAVVRECRRALKPSGSMVVILQPNFRKAGRMRLWPWAPRRLTS